MYRAVSVPRLPCTLSSSANEGRGMQKLFPLISVLLTYCYRASVPLSYAYLFNSSRSLTENVVCGRWIHSELLFRHIVGLRQNYSLNTIAFFLNASRHPSIAGIRYFLGTAGIGIPYLKTRHSVSAFRYFSKNRSVSVFRTVFLYFRRKLTGCSKKIATILIARHSHNYWRNRLRHLVHNICRF